MDAMSPSQRKFDIPSGRGAWKKQLVERFPAEKQAIERFFELVSRASRNSKSFVFVKMMPIWMVTLANRLGIINYWSDFFALGRRTLKETVEVRNIQTEFLWRNIVLKITFSEGSDNESGSSFASYLLLGVLRYAAQ